MGSKLTPVLILGALAAGLYYAWKSLETNCATASPSFPTLCTMFGVPGVQVATVPPVPATSVGLPPTTVAVAPPPTTVSAGNTAIIPTLAQLLQSWAAGTDPSGWGAGSTPSNVLYTADQWSWGYANALNRTPINSTVFNTLFFPAGRPAQAAVMSANDFANMIAAQGLSGTMPESWLTPGGAGVPMGLIHSGGF